MTRIARSNRPVHSVPARGLTSTSTRLAIGLTALPIALASLWPAAAHALELKGTRTITAHTRDAQRIALGTVRFEPAAAGEAVRFVVTMDAARFTDHFLSMKEFKCLDGRGELVCHVPYPHAQPRTVTPANLAWLEHSLLFLYKQPADFGAKLWNGLYFRLEPTATGLRGTPQAIDLNAIASPPETPAPPYRAALRDDIAPGARWIESITIE
jgi:hypothetical protein